jgi:hypothetical protein
MKMKGTDMTTEAINRINEISTRLHGRPCEDFLREVFEEAYRQISAVSGPFADKPTVLQAAALSIAERRLLETSGLMHE